MKTTSVIGFSLLVFLGAAACGDVGGVDAASAERAGSNPFDPSSGPGSSGGSASADHHQGPDASAPDSGAKPDAATPDAAACVPGVQTIAGTRVQPSALATDGTNVYWAEASGAAGLQNVLQAPAQGGTIQTIAFAQPALYAMAVDQAFLYWANEGPTGAQLGGSVMRLSKLGGLPVFLAFDQSPPQGLALDDTSVYFTAGYDVVAVNKLGGPLQVLAIGESPTAIAVDSRPSTTAMRRRSGARRRSCRCPSTAASRRCSSRRCSRRRSWWTRRASTG